MLRFYVLILYAILSMSSLAASSARTEPTVAEETLTLGRYIYTVATDNTIIFERYGAALLDKSIQGNLLSKLPSASTSSPLDLIRIISSIETLGRSIAIDSARWKTIADTAKEWINSLSMNPSEPAPPKLLNAVLDFNLTQEEDYAILKHRQRTAAHPLLNLPMYEPLQKDQLEDLKHIWDKLFKYATPLYQSHYQESNPRYTGKGQTQDKIYPRGAKEAVREVFDPTVEKWGVAVTMHGRLKKAGVPTVITITDRVGVSLDITKRHLQEVEKPAVTLEPYKGGQMIIEGRIVRNDLKNIIFTFPTSGLSLELSRLGPELAEDMAKQYYDAARDMMAEKLIRAGKKAEVPSTPAPVNEETAYMATLSLDELTAYLETGIRPAPGAAKDTTVAKAKQKKEKTKAATLTFSAAEDFAARGGSGAATSDAAASTTTGTKISPAPAFDPRLKEITLRLAYQMALEPLPPLPSRTYATTVEGLKDKDKPMLANLIKSNHGEYGEEPKAVDSYNWNDLVHLMERLGFTLSRNTTFTYRADPVRRINLHYLHYTSHTLNDTLVSIWKEQMANIGFTYEHFMGLLH